MHNLRSKATGKVGIWPYFKGYLLYDPNINPIYTFIVNSLSSKTSISYRFMPSSKRSLGNNRWGRRCVGPLSLSRRRESNCFGGHLKEGKKITICPWNWFSVKVNCQGQMGRLISLFPEGHTLLKLKVESRILQREKRFPQRGEEGQRERGKIWGFCMDDLIKDGKIQNVCSVLHWVQSSMLVYF